MSTPTLVFCVLLALGAGISASYLLFTAIDLGAFLGRHALILASVAALALLVFWLHGRGHLASLRDYVTGSTPIRSVATAEQNVGSRKRANEMDARWLKTEGETAPARTKRTRR